MADLIAQSGPRSFAKGRRLLVVPVDLLQEWLTVGSQTHVQCVEGLPADARWLRLGYDAVRDAYLLVFESAEWEPDPEGMAPKPLAPVVERISG